jgi:chromosome partitioning protein
LYVIAVSNHKGGVGKTTTALAIAACLAKRGQRVLAVDLDPQGNLGMGAGVFTSKDTSTSADVIRGTVRAQDAALKIAHPGLEMLRVIPADVRLAQIEGWLYGKVGYDEILKERLAQAGKACDFVVLDCPPSLGSLTLNAIVAADAVVAPVQCEFFSARGVISLKDMVDLVRDMRRPDLAFHVLPTLYDKRNRICRQVLEKLRKDFARSISNVVIGIDTRVREAQAKGTPLCLYTPNSRASLAYEAVTLELEMMAARQSLSRIAA